MELGESVGAFVPELAKFAVANKIAGAAGITRVLGGLMKSKKPIDKIKGFMLGAALEEVKFSGVTAGESELGAGAFFFAGGMGARALMPFRFKGKAAFANPALEKILLAGVGGATASEVAIVGEGFLKALEGDVDFEVYMNENYGEDAKAMRRFAVSVGTFASIGAMSMKSGDFVSMSKKYELLDKLESEVNNNAIIESYTKKGKKSPSSLDNMDPSNDYKALTKKELEQKKNSINLLKKDIFLSEQGYNNLVMSDQLDNKDAAEKALAEGNLNFIEKRQAKKAINTANANIDRIKRKVNTFKNNVERSGILLGDKKLKVIVTENGKDAQGRDLIASDSKAEYIAERDGIPLNAIVINISKMKPGVGGHELGHAFFKAAFNANPKAAEALKSKIELQVEPVLDGFFMENTGFTFKEFLNKNKYPIKDCKFRTIKMKVGLHKRTFVKNVCAIGLSAGFIEPLESNGLYTVHVFLMNLIRTLQRGEINRFDRDAYNFHTKLQFRNFAEFVAMHYSLSHRTDTKYWKDIQEREFCKDLVEPKASAYNGFVKGVYNKYQHYAFSDNGGLHCIAMGMNWFPTDVDSITAATLHDANHHKDGWKIFIKRLEERTKYREKIVKKMPSFYDYLNNTFYK